MKQLHFLTYLLLFFVFQTKAQSQNYITGRVADEKNAPLELVSIKVLETNQYATTDNSGVFMLRTSPKTNTSLTLEISYIGFQKLSRAVQVKKGETNLGLIYLKVMDLSLENIEISAKRNYGGSSNSSLIINRDIIEQTPALSVNDLLNLIPNRKITAPSLQTVQNLTLRAAFQPTTSGRDAFTLNNSFGVAIILDGNNISNNANMQSYNPGNTGLSNSNISLSGSSYGLTGTSSTGSYSGDYAFGGTDLRQIPADNIESIEVIAGVPSVKYGDLTDGAIIIERQAGKAPAYLRMQIRDNATSYNFNKGLLLGSKLGSLNIGLNYVDSYQDNRDKLKAYKRLNTNAMWTNTFGQAKRLKNTLSFDYGRNLDGIKNDPDDPTSRFVTFNNWNLSLSNRTNYRINSGFLKNISLNLRYSAGHQVSYTEQYVNNPYILYNNAETTGIVQGIYDKGIYTAVSHVDGRPITLSSLLDFNGQFKTGQLTHFINFGGNYNYSANNGLGRLSDPARSRPGYNVTGSSLTAGASERYYDFSLLMAQQDIGLYAEDVFKFKLAQRYLNVRAGLRLDGQNGFVTLSPRTNINYQATENLRIGLAFGMAYKAPGLSQRYPGPIFIDVPLLNAYIGNVAESASIFYVQRYDVDASLLRSSKSQTLEFTSSYQLKDYNMSLTVFAKNNTNGLNTTSLLDVVTLPQYQATVQSGSPPVITQTGTKKYLLEHSVFKNNLKSNNQGFELMLGTPKFEAISTAFNISGGLFRSHYNQTSYRNISPLAEDKTSPEYPVIGIYAPLVRTSYYSSGRITSTTHIPAISLIAQFTAQFSFLDKTFYNSNAGIPLAYYTRNLQYVYLPNPDPNSLVYGHLFIPTEEITANNQPKIFSNYHFSLGKEIKKRFKFSFNVYNVFNYQPRYLTGTSTVVTPNSAPNYGIELSIKL